MSTARGTAIESCEAIERAITQLVQHAPAIDPDGVAELVERLRNLGMPLAMSIARVVELVGDGLVDPGISLPALAMACHTLADGVRGTLSEKELEAARYEIETLLPVPDGPGRPPSRIAEPDVDVGSLIRGRRPRT